VTGREEEGAGESGGIYTSGQEVESPGCGLWKAQTGKVGRGQQGCEAPISHEFITSFRACVVVGANPVPKAWEMQNLHQHFTKLA
jgi:hypothetical protein